MTARHTPGPWVIRVDRDDERQSGRMRPDYWLIESAGGRWVATFPRLVDDAHAQQEADASLIAAAPDLLAALEEACAGLEWYQDMCPQYTDGSDDEAMARIRAALAKATLPAPTTKATHD